MKLKINKGKPVTTSRSRRASMLAFAMIFGLIISVMLIPILSFTTQVTKVTGGTKSSDQAFYAAEAGVSRAISEIVGTLGLGGESINAGLDGSDVFQTMALGRGLNSEDLKEATEEDPWLPWGDEWKTMESDDSVADDETEQGQLSFKVRAWLNEDLPPGQLIYTVQSTGRSMVPRETYRTISVQIQARSFAGYAFFNTTSLSTMDGRARWLAPGETFNGVVHSNRHLFVYGTSGNPLTFNSDVEIVGSEVKQGSPNNNVVYNSLLDQNANYVELPSDLTDLKNGADNGGIRLPGDDTALANVPSSGPQRFVDPVTTADSDMNNYQFVFNADGTVTITNLDLKTWAQSNATTAQAWRTANGYTVATAGNQASFTVDIDNTNGAFVVDEGNVFIEGTLNGKVTVGALANDSNGNLIGPLANTRSDGNVIITNQIIYESHPMVSGNYDKSDGREFDPDDVDDVLGLIGERNMAVDGSFPANGIIDAHIMLTGQASENPHTWNDWNQTTSTNGVTEAIDQDGAFFAERGVQKDLSELWTGVVDGEGGNGTGTYSAGSGNIDIFLTGGIVHFLRGQTSNGTGISRRYAYDQRLGIDPPPFYPITPQLSIIGWRDVASSHDPT